MNPLITPPSDTSQVDEDMVEQAVPGHGIPSQDPDSAAQTLLKPEDAQRETNSALMGGGAVAGVATGAVIGAMVGGPLGVVVGGTVGAVAGAVGGVAAGATAATEDSSHADTAPEELSRATKVVDKDLIVKPTTSI